MKDLYERLYEDVIVKAREAGIPRTLVVRYFMDAYERHKHQHGSFKNHPEYNEKMNGRYLWQHDQTLKYIEELKNAKETR